MIELRHLAHALTLAEYRNFARAAKALHLSQPALTRNIQALEEQVGLPLFERLRSGVEPTDAGQLFLKRAQVILGQADDLMREVGGLRNRVEVGLRVAVDFIREIRRAGAQAAERNQALARTFGRRPRQTANGRKRATSSAK